MQHLVTPAYAGAASAAKGGSHDAAGHDLYQEGLRLGLLIAVVTWCWVLLVDLVIGQPFHAFNALGGVVTFTIIHLLLNAVYGIALVWAIHGVAHEHSLAIGLIFLTIMIQVAFAMATILLSNLVLGSVAWLEIFSGNLVATAVALVVVARRHPLLEQLHQAEVEG